MHPARRRTPIRLLDHPDLSWARRLVVVVTLLGLVAVACSSGSDSNDASSRTTSANTGATSPPATSTSGGKTKIDVLPGMPPVSDPDNLYSDDAPDKLSPEVKGALSRVYVPNHAANTVSVIDPTTMQVVDTFPVGINPQHIVPSWDLKTLWVTNNAEGRTDGSLTPIDPTTGKPGTPIAVDDPYNMYFTPDGKSAIVVAEAFKRLDFRDPHTMQLQSSLSVPTARA